MKPLKQVFIYTLLTLTVVLSQTDNDESRPYEFGFTIDGEQHRHEKKDQNGIVQGEFGFITADGIYHVTVYATDENGRFKILSMRNIRISAPLDGSPATGPISPEAGKYLGKQKLQGNVPALPTSSQLSQQPPQQPQPQPQPQPLPLQAHPLSGSFPQQLPSQLQQGPQPPPTITEKPKPYEFTTQPTIKPACGGCGFVTTQKPVPGQPFPFQDPAIKKLLSSGQSVQNVQGAPQGLVQPLGGQQKSEFNQYNQQQYSQNQQQNLRIQQNIAKQQQPFAQNPQSGVSLIEPRISELLPPGTNEQYQGQNNALQGQFGLQGDKSQPQTNNLSPLGTYNQIPGANPLIAQGENVPNIPFGNLKPELTGTIQTPPFGNFGTGPTPSIQSNEEISKLPPISVSDNTIRVGGSKLINIPIRDKYPGMVDGLPEGIEEKDIKDILYKFHYTVGFHGHYEKGLKNGAKIGGYFVNGRDGISRVVTYIADENGYRPKFKFINLGLDSPDTPKEGTEKQFGLKSFEFVWYPIE